MTPALCERVIVGVDDTDAGIAALREAVAMACAHHARLVAVRAWQLGQPRHGGRRFRHATHRYVVLYFSDLEQRVAAVVLIRKALARAWASRPSGLEVRIATPRADPAIALCSIAQRAGDILVLGDSRRISPRVLVHGSVTAYCVRHARCPVLVVPPQQALSHRGAVHQDGAAQDGAARSARRPNSRSMASVSFSRSGTAS
jgi:nucleotide-binding universal stress UspA family protein